MYPGSYGCVMLQYIPSTINVVTFHRMHKFSLYKKKYILYLRPLLLSLNPS